MATRQLIGWLDMLLTLMLSIQTHMVDPDLIVIVMTNAMACIYSKNT